MKIQWYPGHMHKARKEMQKVLPKIDVIIEILDARIPFSSENPIIASLSLDKPVIKVLNKCDLADEVLTEHWQLWLEKERNVKTLALTTQEPVRYRQVISLAEKLVVDKLAAGKTAYAMILGIPNVGKSTLINTMVGRIVAKSGNEPAVTKGQQQIQLLENLILIDTPGVLWPNVENRNSGYRLAVTGAVKDTALEYDDIAFFAAEYLLKAYPDRLIDRFELDALPESEYELLEKIGHRRGCLRSGGDVQLDRVSKVFVHEIRAGKLGRLTFEIPEMMAQELVEMEIERARKAEKKAARKKRN